MDCEQYTWGVGERNVTDTTKMLYKLKDVLKSITVAFAGVGFIHHWGKGGNLSL